ncbi:outer membrane efflux lipoprotein [Aliidongia dinghuensis]|uniref:Outer membrane efflux lipoprotein n=1 Tax=Aliidongia dinghuensis TaxID=1867774 RepID=A0A8J3E0T7_9PROT|nr:efflux transporter outer membrane subunit [Aliidongia dinghuensis]GGF04940.1 outer membrane efflux lipoprotein [Aliidongia dinghuensis]
MSSRLIGVLGLAATLSACNLAPDYHPPLVAVPATYKETGPWQPAAPSDDRPRGAWWQRFTDPTLDRLEPEIDTANPDLAATVARYDQARALAAEAEAGLDPQVGLGASLTANRQSKTRPLRGSSQPNFYGANQAAVTAGYEIDLWGKLHNEAASGTALAQASAADLASMRLSLEAELATDYFTLRGLDANARLLTDTADAYQKALDLTRTLFQGKIASSLDVSRAETQLETAKAQLSDVTARRALMEHAIASLVGQPAGGFSIPSEVRPFTLPDVPASVPSTLLERRPDIAAAERTVAAANSEIGVARAAFYPSLSLNLLAGFQSSGLNLLSLPNSFWSVGPDVSLPLFTGGRLEAEESAAYARFREASGNYRATVLAAFQEVEDNLAELHGLGEASQHEEAGVTAAQHALDVALSLYHEGASSYLEVVTAQTALLQAQQAALDFRTRRLTADVGLIRALGGGWDTTDLPSEAAATKLAANVLESGPAAQGSEK